MSHDALIFLLWHCDSELSNEVIITQRLTNKQRLTDKLTHDANVLLYIYRYFVPRLWFNFAAETQAATQ